MAMRLSFGYIRYMLCSSEMKWIMTLLCIKPILSKRVGEYHITSHIMSKETAATVWHMTSLSFLVV